MDLTLTDDQRLLVETARAFVARSQPEPTLRSMAELGWTELALPELTLVCEELGRGAVSSPLATTVTVARWLPDLATGTRIGTLAVLEPGMRDEWDPPAMSGQGPMSGTKVLVPWAEVSDLIVVATADGLRVVERGAVRVTPHEALGGDPLASVELDRCEAEPLQGPGLNCALDHAAVANLGYAVGVAERMLELSVRHARDREQFGRPIGAFQAVAHRCADMRADVDACRYLAYQAAWALDRGGEADAEVAAAKSYANDALRRVAMHAHQVHGAIGFSTEHDLHRFSRRAKAFELSYGSTARHRERLAAAMGLRT